MGIISYAQNFEDVLLWRALGHIEQGCYIDIGAHDPIIDSVSKAFHEHGWRGIHVEPLPIYCDALRSDRPDETVLQAAVAAKTGILRFYEIPDTGISTGNEAIAQSHRERGFRINEINVPCVTLAQVFQLVKGDVVHWLKIDVEGLEEQVLQGWGGTSLRPWIVVVESTLPLTQDEVFSAWEALLLEKGYRCVYFDGLNRYYLVEEQSALESAFRSGPNVFDGFQLNGTASNTFTLHVAQRIRDELGGQIELLKQQALLHKTDERRLAEAHEHSERLKQALQSEQAANLLNQNAAKALALQCEHRARIETEDQLRTAMQREQQFTAQLLAAKDQLQQLELARNAREQQLQEQLIQSEQQSKQEIEARLRTATLREQEFSSQWLAAKDQLHQLEEARWAREQVLQEQLVQVEQQARQEIEAQLRTATHREQVYTAQLKQLESEHRNRQVALLERLAQNESQSRLESEAHFQRMLEREQAVAEQLLALRQQAAEELSRQAIELQSQHEERRLAWDVREKALYQEISDRSIEAQALRHANELQDQKHCSEVRAHAATEAGLRAEIEAIEQANIELRQNLQLVQECLSNIQGSLSWRVTSPLRKLWYRFVSEPSKISPSLITRINSLGKQTDHIPVAVSGIAASANLHGTPSTATDATIVNNIELHSTEQTMTPIHHVQDLLKLSGERMVRASYSKLLGRDPDTAGLAHYSNRLQQGYGRTRVLVEIASSEEARIKAVDLPGLKELVQVFEANRSWWRRLITPQNRYEQSLNRVEELLDALRENAQQAEQRLHARLVRLEEAILALQSGVGPGMGPGGRTQVQLAGELVQPQSLHGQGQRGQLWLKRLQSIQGRK